MTRRIKAPPINLTETEQVIFDDYIQSYQEDYSGLTETDLIQLRDAAVYHILQYRLIESGATSTTVHNVRTSPKSLERGILDDLSLNRKQRIMRGQANTDEAELKELLMSIGSK
jgi:hypothetical protein